jgi:antitoxin component of MazEF toxin-antitoxin module
MYAEYESDREKWGNSAAVRIPEPIMEAADIHLEDVVKGLRGKGRIIIEPIRSKTDDVNDLVKAITSRNLHEPSISADQVKSLDWRGRNARLKDRVSPEQLAEVRAKIKALIGGTAPVAAQIVLDLEE